MRRSGFTMIELIFVIVILGILAAIALPRFGGVQDDALVANEKAGISAVRSGVSALSGRFITRGAESFITTIVDASGATVDLNVTRSGGPYPGGLSTAAGTPRTVTLAASELSEDHTMAVVLEPSARNQWRTSAIGDANATNISGPASRGVTDATAEVNTGTHWRYNANNGQIRFIDNGAYSATAPTVN